MANSFWGVLMFSSSSSSSSSGVVQEGGQTVLSSMPSRRTKKNESGRAYSLNVGVLQAVAVGGLSTNRDHEAVRKRVLRDDSSERILGRGGTTTKERTGKDTTIVEDYATLLETVTTRQVHPDQVAASMLKLEKQSYKALTNVEQSERMAHYLEGDWSPVFSSGTTTTQKRLGGRPLNYFPVKAVISFRQNHEQDHDKDLMQNGIYFGDFHAVRLTGWYQYRPKQRKMHFGYHHISLLNGAFTMELKEGQDIEFALATGLGGKIGLWNILMADPNMMMARGAGHGLTLWKRREGHTAVFEHETS